MATGSPILAAPTAVRDSATIAVWTLVSRATGFLRVVVIGAVLGPTYLANTIVATNTVPNLLYSLIAGQTLALVVVPAIVRAIEHSGLQDATVLLGRIGGFLITTSGALAALLLLASPVVAWLMTGGITHPTAHTRAEFVATMLVLLVIPQIVLYAVAALGAAAQQARGRFAIAAAAPAVENVVLMAAVACSGLIWDSRVEVEQAPTGLFVTIGGGSTLAVALHAGLQAFGAARAGLPLRPSLRWWSDSQAVEITRRLLGSVWVPAAPGIAMLARLTVAATVPGGVIVVQTAFAVYQVPTALGARAVSTAVLPGMSAATHRNDEVAFASAWRQALSYAAITSLPAVLMLSVLAHPVAAVLAHGELRSAQVIDELAACVAGIAIAQPVSGLHEVGRQALFARIDIRGPRQASLASLGAGLPLTVAALLAPPGTQRLVVLCLALLAGELAGAGTVLTKLRAAIRPERMVDWARLRGVSKAALVMVPPVLAGSVLTSAATGRLAEFGALAGCGLVALGSYAAMLRFGYRKSMGRPI